MALSVVLARGRERALMLMTDTVKVTRPGAKTWDESTGTYTYPPVTVYRGPGKLMMSEAQGNVSRSDVQGQILTMQQPVLKLPITAPAGDEVEGDPGAVFTDDECVIEASTMDGAQVGRVVKVTGLQLHSNATQRRFPVEVVS